MHLENLFVFKVRELQRFTGAQVKIPDDAANAETEQTTVQIIGNFNAAQVKQQRLTIVSK